MRKAFVVILCFFLLVTMTSARGASAKKGLSGTAGELELFELLEKSKFVKAREIAEKMLSLNQESYAANYAMGVITRRAETNLPKSLFYLERARQFYEREHGARGGDSTTWRWHLLILYELICTTAEMDLYEKQLQYLQAYDAAYIPRQTAYYAWPLMKLGRIREARKKIDEALKESRNAEDRIAAMNTWGSIEADLDNREEAYIQFRNTRKMASGKTGFIHIKTNFASSAVVLLKFEEAEKEYLDAAAEGPQPYEISDPWQDLAYLYTLEGRFDEAAGALKKMIQWGLGRMPHLDQQCASGEESTKALFLLACGYPEQAQSITKQLVNRPDRLGYTSQSKFSALTGAYMLHFLAIEDYLGVLRERLVWEGARDRLRGLLSIASLELEKSLLKSRIKCIAISNGALRPTLMPYNYKGIGTPEFVEPDITSIIGSGLITSEIARIRKDYKYKQLAEPYLREFEGELAYRRHDYTRALRLFSEAQEKLPGEEKLLRARTWALSGRIEEKSGEFSKALGLYEKAYQVYPSIFRHLKIRLPVKIRVEGGDTALAGIKKCLARSPRFSQKDRAFVIEIRAAGNTIRGSLLDSHGNSFFTASTARTKDPRKDRQIFLDEFHLKAFSAPISFSAADINSLDGSNLKGEQMRGTIRDLLFEDKSGKDKKEEEK